jgi:hypothetical protein
MSDTTTLVRALRVLARDIHCEDGIAVQCITEAADAIERLRLTDEEREALERGICSLTGVEDLSECADPMDDACTIRGLLKRLGGPDE